VRTRYTRLGGAAEDPRELVRAQLRQDGAETADATLVVGDPREADHHTTRVAPAQAVAP